MHARPANMPLTSVLVVFALMTAASCATIDVPCCNTSDLSYAVASASGGDEIQLAPGIFSGSCDISIVSRANLQIIGNDTTILCTSGNGFVVRNATNLLVSAMVLSSSSSVALQKVGISLRQSTNVSLVDFTLSGWNLGMNVSASRVFCSDLILTNNGGSTNGRGGLVRDASFASFNRSVFSNNIASGSDGGALFISDTSSTNISSAVFASNFAANGGAVAVNSTGSVRLDRCVAQDNSASGSGGGVVVRACGSLVISASSFSGCNSSLGAGLSIDVSSTTGCDMVPFVYDSLFQHNAALLDGGAVRARVAKLKTSGSLLRLRNVTFNGNVAIRGGAIELKDHVGLDAFSTNFCNNHATNGSSLLVNHDSTKSSWSRSVVLTGVTVINEGGMDIQSTLFFATRRTILLTNVTLDGRCSNCQTTAIDVHDQVVTDFSGVSSVFGLSNAIIRNFGAGASISEHLEVDFTNCTFEGLSKGGITTFGNEQFLYVTLTKCSFRGCGGSNGGVVTVQPRSILAVSGSCFTDNLQRAIVIFETCADTTVSNSTFRNNSCSDLQCEGGAIFINWVLRENQISSLFSQSILNLQYVTFINNHAFHGGAVAALTTTVKHKSVLYERNSATMGGAVYNTDPLSLGGDKDVRYVGNAADIGGAIYYDGRYVTQVFTGIVAINNTASSFGGAIYLAHGGTITGSTFINNSALNGGALLSQRYNVQLSSCVFDNNVAARVAGALFLGGESGLITMKCAFRNNLAGTDGGAVFVDAGTFSVLVVTTSFVSNVARNGAGLYLAVGEVNQLEQFIVSNSTFVQNTARESGGGLYSTVPVLVNYTSFTFNAGIAGGGLYGTGAIQISECEFANNTATQGAAVNCQDCSLTLENSYLHDNNATDGAGFWCNDRSQLVSLNRTTIGDNRQSDPALPATCNDCGCCDEPVFPTLLNPTHACVLFGDRTCPYSCAEGYAATADSVRCGADRQVVPAMPCAPVACAPLIAPAFATITQPAHPATGDTAVVTCASGYGIASGDATRVCRGPVWLGVEPVCALNTFCNVTVDATVSSDDCLNATVPLNTSCTFTCRAGSSGRHTSAVSACLQDPSTLRGVFLPAPAECTPCVDGSYAADDAIECTTCPSRGATHMVGATRQADCYCSGGFYEATPGEGDCVACPPGAYCAGDKEQPVADGGFFLIANSYVQCEPTAACNRSNVCNQGYDGFLCGTCARGYYRLNGYCLQCPEEKSYRIVLAVLGAVICAVGLVRAVEPGPVGERSYGMVSTTIALSFVQVIAAFADLRVVWPEATRKFFDVFSYFNLNVEVASPECAAPGMDFYDKFIVWLVIPLIVAGAFVIIWGVALVVQAIRACSSAAFPTHARDYARRLAAGYLFFLTLAYLLLAKAALSVFGCELQPDGRYTLFADASQQCYTAHWRGYAAVGIVAIIIYVAGIPLATFGIYLHNMRKYGGFVARRGLFSAFIVRRYHDRQWFWEALVMLRKLLLVIVSTFLAWNPYLQVAVCLVIFWLALIGTVVVKPHRWSKHNFVENISLVASLLVLFAGLSNVTLGSTPTVEQVSDVISVVTLILSLISMGACMALEISIWRELYKLKSKIRPEHVDELIRTEEPIAAMLNTPAATVVVITGGLVRALDRETNNVLREFVTKRNVVAVATIEENVLLAHDDYVDLFDLGSGAQRGAAAVAGVTAMSAARDIVAVLHGNGAVSRWRCDGVSLLALGELKRRVPREDSDEKEVTDSATFVAIHVRGPFIFTGAADGLVQKWNAESGVCLRTWRVSLTGAITCVAARKGTVAVGDDRGHVVVIHPETGVLSAFHRHGGPITCLALLDEAVISGCSLGTLVASSSLDGHYLQTLPGEGTSGALRAVLASESRDSITWATAAGVAKACNVHSLWHVHDRDPHPWSRHIAPRLHRARLTVCGCCCRGERARISDGSAASKPLFAPDAPTEPLFDELQRFAEELEVGRGDWAQLSASRARALATALARDGLQSGGARMVHPIEPPTAGPLGAGVVVVGKVVEEAQAEAAPEYEAVAEVSPAQEPEPAASESVDEPAVERAPSAAPDEQPVPETDDAAHTQAWVQMTSPSHLPPLESSPAHRSASRASERSNHTPIPPLRPMPSLGVSMGELVAHHGSSSEEESDAEAGSESSS